ncbi:MAG: prepilin peptidase [Patescibacteria group bacterium]
MDFTSTLIVYIDVFLIVLLGFAVGSFLNAVIYRLHAGVSFMRGRSYCPRCKHDLAAKDLVPVVSFVLLRGKCRYCHKPISWQYPLVEFSTAVLFVLLYAQFGIGATFFVYLVYTCFLIVIFVYDLRYYLILDKVSIPALALALMLSLTVLDISILSVVIGMLIGGGFFFLQHAVSRGKWIGGGDIRLGIVMGAMLGWEHLLVALFGAYIFGSIIGIGLVLFGNKRWRSQVPFGTFLTVATFLTFLCADPVVSMYKDLFLL